MKITNIKINKKKVVVELENSTSFEISEATKDSFNLYKGKDIENEINLIKKEDKIQKLVDMSLKRLLMHDYSPIKLREFLIKKKAKKDEINEVIKRLQKYSFLNEEEIIKNIISFCDSKHYGFNRIILMCKQRQISESKIQKIKFNLTREEKEAGLQKDLLVKKYKNKNTKNLKNAVFASLIRYGFNEDIASLYSSLVFNSPKNEINMLKLEYRKLFSSYSRKIKGDELEQKIIDKLLMKGYSYSDIRIVLEENKNEMG